MAKVEKTSLDPKTCLEAPDVNGATNKGAASVQLINYLAYQIRTLSNAIIGFSNLLAADDLTDTQREYVAEIHQAGKGLSGIVNDVVDLARLEAGTLRPDFAECNLAELLEEIESSIRRAAVSKGLSFSIQTEKNVPAFLYTDPVRLKRCLLNLAANAVQYTPRGTIQLCVRMDSSGPPSRVRFDMKDTGIGIAPERLPHLFDPLQEREQINTDMLTRIHLGMHGCGLLPLTHQIVQLLGGQMEAVSELGAGSTFSILLPAEPANRNAPMLTFPPPLADPYAPAEKSEDKQYIGCILLVEDEESNRTVLTLMLENLGLNVVAVASGQAALDTACQTEFDAVLMDLQLPDISGLEVARQLRDKGLQTPMIALSAGLLADGQSRRIEELFDAFLAKPVDRPQLAEVLQSLLPTIQKQQTIVHREHEKNGTSIAE